MNVVSAVSGSIAYCAKTPLTESHSEIERLIVL